MCVRDGRFVGITKPHTNGDDITDNTQHEMRIVDCSRKIY